MSAPGYGSTDPPGDGGGGEVSIVSTAGPLYLNDLYRKIGFGRAQVLFWSILSLIAVMDTVEQVLISLVIPYLKCEWNLTLFFEGLIAAAVFVFYGISSVVFGRVADKQGRKSVLTVTLVLLLFTALGSALAQNKWQFLLARSVTGACIGANFGVIVSYATEVVEDDYRSIGVSLIILVSKVGMFITALLGYLLLNSVGWRWFIVSVSLPLLPAIAALQFVPESPRYLVTSGQQERAQSAVKWMARLNRAELSEEVEVKCYEGEDLGDLGVLFGDKYIKETVLLSVIYFGNILIFLSLILFLPLAFNSEFCGGDGASPEHKCKKLSQQSLLKVAIVISATIKGLLTAHGLSHVTGRVPMLRLFSSVTFLACLLLYRCYSQTITLVLLFVVEFAASGLNILVWIIILENYPTSVRTTASGFVNFWGKIGGVIGVIGVYVLFYVSPYLVVTMYVVASLMSFVGSVLFTKETRDLEITDVAND